MSVSVAAPATGIGWVDLSQPLSARSDRASRTKAPSFTQVMTIERDHFSMMEYSFSSHLGTHLDAPCHFVPGAASIDAVPLERLVGRGVVLDVAVPALAPVTAEHLARGGPEPGPGEIVLLRTGWEDKAGTPEYFRHPYIDVSACRWLVERRVSMVGIDLVTPDMPEVVRDGPFDWPAHHGLMDNGVLVMENVCNLRSLVGKRVEVIAVPISIEGGDGAPVRPLARAIEGIVSSDQADRHVV